LTSIATWRWRPSRATALGGERRFDFGTGEEAEGDVGRNSLLHSRL
jgi:hypothetical protein